MVWAGGYASGELVAHLYDDAIAALKRWAAARRPVYVYSSGSIAAQKLYFAHTAAGDLTPCLAGYFDTTTGPKQDAESYRRIASAIGRPAADLLFLSDVAAELEAAADGRLPGGAGAARAPCRRPVRAVDHHVRRASDLKLPYQLYSFMFRCQAADLKRFCVYEPRLPARSSRGSRNGENDPPESQRQLEEQATRH